LPSCFSSSSDGASAIITRLLAAAAFAAHLSAAGAAEHRIVSFTLENDFFAGYDQHYTNGMQAAFLADAPFAWSADPQMVVAIGQRMYTPANSDRALPDPHDRPYAGWLYFMTDIRTRAGGGVIDHLTVTAGVVGPASGARRTQDLFHHVSRAPASGGWDAQLGNEPTLMLGYERAWPGVLQAGNATGQADLALRAAATVGTPLTYASAGAVLRFGRHLPSDIPTTHISLGPPRDGFRGAAQFGWYAWIGADAHAIARNVFVQGNTFRDSAGVELRPYGIDAQAGIAAAWPTARVGFTLVHRSREFVGQGGADKFGQLALSFAY